MKTDIRQMIKTVIEENAVSFKDHASKVLYEKVGSKLQEKYQTVAKSIMSKKVSEK